MSNAGSWWRRYVPGNVSNPLRLAARLLAERKPAARSAMMMAAAGILLTPIDWSLRPFERREYSRASESERPILIVVGPPRSGTTLVAQYLINAFNVAYINNLTSLFPGSPITVNRVLKHVVPLRAGDYDAFYGKSRGLAGANDGLYIWDRWLGSDRHQIPTRLEDGASDNMLRFFGAMDGLYQLPVVTKVNGLNTCAHLVTEVLQNARFLCMQRDPLHLAQSLYFARRDITGNMRSAYGVQHPNSDPEDPIEDVCQQVLFHERNARQQQELLGESRFSVVSYEDFCRKPRSLVDCLLEEHDALSLRQGSDELATSFTISDRIRLSGAQHERMRNRLSELGAGQIRCRRL